MIYQFINNIGDFFSTGYFTEDFIQKVQSQAGRNSDDMRQLGQRFAGLREQYFSYKGKIMEGKLTTKYRIQDTHNFNTTLLKALGYNLGEGYDHWLYLDDHSVIPVRHILNRSDQREMLIMEMQPMLTTECNAPDGLFEQHYDDETGTDSQRYRYQQWSEVIKKGLPEDCKISPSVINEAITAIFYLPENERPRYILMMAGNKVYLIDSEKWQSLSYLEFDIEQLFIETQATARNRDYFVLFYLLCSRETLANETDISLMEKLEDESYKNAYAVTRDLRDGVVNAVESLANEALWYKRSNNLPFGKYDEARQIYDETDDDFEAEVRDDCLTIIYRLLFLFYAESRPELKILPTDDEVYQRGYSLEMLRDLEQVPLQSQQELNGYFFDDSIKQLFTLLSSGREAKQMEGPSAEERKRGFVSITRSFSIKKIDSPMFNDNKLNQLNGARFRNFIWQDIICSLSLSREVKGKARGRISYSNLGINQLGSVYESLLAYRGFYAEEDYIEVHKDGDTSATYLVPRSRMDVFKTEEILSDAEGMPKILKKGSFVYRLNGRDRQKSASYYTPEVLTKSTVKYTLMGFRERLEKPEDDPEKMKADELLNLKILEPAMGAAAFQNEVINQLAKLYIDSKEKELVKNGAKHISPDRRQDETQKVKAYIATHNVYGVDLNPTAIELGKLSLWLNVIHNDMETPFFSNRLALGNAVIGAWLKCYSRNDVVGKPKRNSNRLDPTKWWEKVPHKISFYNTRVKRSVNDVYHFLLPDPGMLAVTNIRELKQIGDNDKRAKAMKELIKDWTAPIYDSDFAQLQRISQKIDILLKEYFDFQTKLNLATYSRDNLYGQSASHVLNLDTYDEKEFLNDRRNRHDNAYRKLKTVMDYWCSLWFWELKYSELLPHRSEFWNDIEAILNVSNDKLKIRWQKIVAGADKKGQLDMFLPKEEVLDFDSETNEGLVSEPAPISADELSEFISEAMNKSIAENALSGRSLYEDSQRVLTVQRLAKRYHFFHPMLEFLEVFWLRDGFDIICGNPPWIKYEFDEISIMSEKFPEVAIRRVIAPDVRAKRAEFFQNPAMEEMYCAEQMDYAGSVAFMNALCNYPMLKGQQTNLYKCVLENGFSMMSDKGFMGLLHPETVYDDPNGQPLRKEMYHRLKYHFQYQNAFNLFEIGHREKYSTNVYGSRKDIIDFENINNLFYPSTIDDCYAHDGHGICGGIKIDDAWNTQGHRNRIIRFTETELRILADTFESGADWEATKLVSIHTVDILNVLKFLSAFPKHVSDYDANITEDLHETGAVNSGIIRRETFYPQLDNYEMVYNGPQIYVANPSYKTPKEVCIQKADYDTLDLMTLPENYIARSNYRPLLPLNEYRSLIKGFLIGQNLDGNEKFDNWIDHYKVGFRKMINLAGERSLICAVLPRRTAHIHGVISSSFVRGDNAVDMAALCAAVPMDAYMKIMASQNLTSVRIQGFPLGVDPKFNNALRSRTLLLNCLTTAYSDLWNEMWKDDYKQEYWSKEDERLKPFDELSNQWNWNTPLRNYCERRQALVEIDVIVSMALGISLENLESLYTIYFPVLQQNEADTWYDTKGNIVFTCSKGLAGVGVDRPVWETIRDMKPGETYDHEIQKSELYRGRHVTYNAPFTKCDRIEDYRRAWAFFEGRFK